MSGTLDAGLRTPKNSGALLLGVTLRNPPVEANDAERTPLRDGRGEGVRS